MYETSSEPPRLSSIRLSVPDDQSFIAPLGFHDDYGIKNAVSDELIPGLGSVHMTLVEPLSYLTVLH